MKNYGGYIASLLIGALLGAAVFSAQNGRTEGWHLVYAHDKDGAVTEGNKTALVNAVLSGKQVRVYWEGRYVKHTADAGFLTVIGDDVFAQISEIRGQRPTETPPSITLTAPDVKWTGLFATNGDRALKWFVRH